MWNSVNLEKRTMKKILTSKVVKIQSSIRTKQIMVILDICALKQIFPVLYYSFISGLHSRGLHSFAMYVYVFGHLCIFLSICNLEIHLIIRSRTQLF